MKRLVSVMLIMIIMAGLFPTTAHALPTEGFIKAWILSDSGKNIYVDILQYPRTTIIKTAASVKGVPLIQAELHEIALEMELDLSQKYFQYFKNGDIIPELVLNGINQYEKPSFKFTLENCTVCGYTVSELSTGRLIDPMKAVVRFSAEKITSAEFSSNSGPMQITYSAKLDTGKLLINGTEYGSPAAFSKIDGFSMIVGAAGEEKYGGPLYNSSEMSVQYDQIGMLPDWLASLDLINGDILSIDPQCKLRYELSSTQTNDELTFEADLTAIGQELKDHTGIKQMFANYTFKVSGFDFVTSAAPADSPPAAPAKLFIRETLPTRTIAHTWAGNWVTTFGKMTLKQNGAEVTGEYGNPIETLEGTATGSKLSGTWHDSLSSGKFEFTMSADGKSFSGNMYSRTIGDRGTFEWSGDREQ